MRPLIALVGLAGAGKDTLADHLVDRHGYYKRGFATPLYEEVARAFGVTIEWLADRTRKEVPQTALMLNNAMEREPEFVYDMFDEGVPPTLPLSPRQVLQWWGTEYRRSRDENYWIRKMDEFFYTHHPIVIIDMRFENEARWAKDNNAFIVRVTRAGLAPVEGKHASAAGLDDHWFNAVVANDNDKFLLWKQADDIAGVERCYEAGE